MVHHFGVLYLLMPAPWVANTLELFHCFYSVVDIRCDTINLCDHQNNNEMAFPGTSEGTFNLIPMVRIRNIHMSTCYRRLDFISRSVSGTSRLFCWKLLLKFWFASKSNIPNWIYRFTQQWFRFGFYYHRPSYMYSLVWFEVNES